MGQRVEAGSGGCGVPVYKRETGAVLLRCFVQTLCSHGQSGGLGTWMFLLYVQYCLTDSEKIVKRTCPLFDI